jgi:hypothetical protein
MEQMTKAKRRWSSAPPKTTRCGARPDQSDEDEHRSELLPTGDGQRRQLGEQHLRDFQDNEKTIPTILTTSQKLSTGVDPATSALC